MSKIWLITKREYSTRVRNKTFLLSTFLLPIMIVVFIAGSVLLAMQGKSRHRIGVLDENNYFKNYLKGDSTLSFDLSPGLDTLNYEKKGCTALLIIPRITTLPSGNALATLNTLPANTPSSPTNTHPSDSVSSTNALHPTGTALRAAATPAAVTPQVTTPNIVCRLIYKKQLGFTGEEDLKQRIRSAMTDHLIYEKTGVERARLDSIRATANLIEFKSYEDQGGKAHASSQGLSYGIGYASGLLIYLLTFIYGAAVMRGVMEEKTNRIAEVIVSSVKPFQLMMGKIIGIGAVGLTQFLLWIVLITSLAFIAQGLIPHDTWKEVQQIQQASAVGNPSTVQAGEAARRIFAIRSTLDTANWGLILFCFLFYFIGGYLFYSSLFAAVGSAVNEDPQEAQSLMLPITMPVIFSFIIMSIAVQDPGGSLAVWASIIPFSAPIVMMARIPFGVPGTVPWWQLGLSMALLVLGFLFTVWMAGRIYRTGILMYGKKPTWKTMWKWAFKKM